jgi:hypothetical protein
MTENRQQVVTGKSHLTMAGLTKKEPGSPSGIPRFRCLRKIFIFTR